MFGTASTTFFALWATLIILSYFYFRKQYSFWKTQNVFYIPPMPLIGNFLPVLLLKKSVGVWAWDLYKQVKDQDFFGVYIFDKPFLFVRSPELIKHILINDAFKFQSRERTIAENDEMISNILFLSPSINKWKHQRSKVTSVFSSGKLKMMYSLLFKQTDDLIAFLKDRVPTESINIEEVVAKYTINCIARCAFGVEANCFKSEDAEFRQIGREMFEFSPSLAYRQTSTFFFPFIVKVFGLKFWPERTIQKLRSIFQNILKERASMKTLKGNDLVDMLLEIRKHDSEFTDNVLLAHAIQFFGAGFETTASTIAFSFYELALHCDLQTRLREDILAAKKKLDGDDFTYEAINEIKYLDMVISEVLRKYPIIPVLDRRCNEDFEVPHTNFVIKKNTPILISTLGLHHDEKYFPDPEKFDPERFVDKYSINAEGLYYLAFGAGPRNCLGDRFARTVVKLALINILSNFKIEKCKNTPDKLMFEPTSFILHSTVGVPIKMTKL